jgi:ferredoxin/flavodoxin---NADP+ reductase
LEQKLGTQKRPLRVAIIGAGPAAFYAAEALFKQTGIVSQIDMFNRFPTPFGLVREGVAPDHESIKAVTRIYDKIAQNPNFRYFGNVTFGTDVTLDDLKSLYDQIIYAVGAQSDRKMGIPGEDLNGSYPATVFVGWYNCHPDYADLDFNLENVERVAVIGNGNVAMDVTRILVTNPDELAKTDMADHAIEKLRTSGVKEVIMLGRRGPAQAAFTNPELKEFGELEGVDTIVDAADLTLDPASETALANDRNATRNMDTLRKYAEKTEHSAPRRITMRFLASPVEVIDDGNGKVGGLKIEKNRLDIKSDGSVAAKGTGEYETLPVQLVLRSVGYRGVPLVGVPFNEATGTIANLEGRVTRQNTGEIVPGQYVVGWAKRGPSGIIGTNKPDSAATVAKMVEDAATLPGIADAERDPAKIVELLDSRNIQYITFEQWQKLNAAEVSRGEPHGRPRVKFVRVPEMLEIAGATEPKV